MLFGYNLHFIFRKRCSFSIQSSLEKEILSSWLGENKQLCAQFNVKNIILLLFVIVMLF